jgi:queuine/archaeosine tRNA-ribosyltransferase
MREIRAAIEKGEFMQFREQFYALRAIQPD